MMKYCNCLNSHYGESRSFNCFKMIPIQTMKLIRLNRKESIIVSKVTKQFYNRKNRNTRKLFLNKEINELS